MKYLLRSSNPLKYQLKSTVLYSLVYWKPSTALAASPFALSLAAAICSSFSLVHSRSTLSSSVKVRNFSLAWLASSIVAMSSFLCFEFSASKDDAWDRADSTLVSEARYSEVMWRLSPSTGIKIKGVHNLLKKKKKKEIGRSMQGVKLHSYLYELMEITPRNFVCWHSKDHLKLVCAKGILSSRHGDSGVILDTRRPGVNFFFLLLPNSQPLVAGRKLFH